MKKQLIKEAFRLQQIAGLRPVNEILPSSDTPRRRRLQREEVGQAQTTTFSPQDIKSVSFANGTSFTVGDIDMEGGIVISIEKTSTGFEVSGYGDGEGYTYYYDMQGNEIEAEGMSRSMQKEQEGGMNRQVYIKITGGSRGEIEDVDILNVPGDPDTFMQNEYDEEINRRTDNGTDEEEMENIEEFADFNKVGDGMYQMVFNPEESAAFISTNLPKVKAYMQKNGYNSVESFVEYLVEEADSEEIYDFLDQIGAEGI